MFWLYCFFTAISVGISILSISQIRLHKEDNPPAHQAWILIAVIFIVSTIADIVTLINL
jgi:hypothetical protein